MSDYALNYGTTVIFEALSRKRWHMLREGAEADNYINRIKGLKMIGYDK